MAQFRESEQIQQQGTAQGSEEELIQTSTPVNQSLIDQTDDILDEIDSLLEENAEDYVRGFVQKGGQ